MKTTTSIPATEPVFIGIDYHKKYSVYCVIDNEGEVLERGRIDHREPELFIDPLKRHPGCRVAFEASLNWQWLYEIVEPRLEPGAIVIADPFKTRIIGEAQVKTDKIDAHILAQLLRAGLVCSVHIPGKATRQLKDVLRQRCFFVRQRTRLRNRIHRLLGAQHDLELPQCSDIFGRKGMSFLSGLELPEPDGMLLAQQLEMLRSLEVRIREDEAALKKMTGANAAMERLRSMPGMGPILAAVVVSEIDDIARFPNAQKLCGYAGLCPSTLSSGGKTVQGRLMRRCNKWLRWAYVEAAWVAVGCDGYFAQYYRRKRACGKKANTAILATARRMARISWQLLTQERDYRKLPLSQQTRRQPDGGVKTSAGLAKETGRSARRQAGRGRKRKISEISPVAPI